jgi:hypothetical protein
MGTYFVCLDIYGGQKHNVYFMTQILHFSFMLTLMLPGPVIPVAWKSKKQAVVSRSSTEAELRALATTTAEIIWIRWLLADLGVSCDSPTLLRCDNTGTIQICHDPVKRELTKHIGVDVSFTRYHCHQKTIDLQYVPSELQLADFFTKAQTRAQHQFHLLKLNASNPPLPP